jgi:propionyl-CoA carboxylase alpha chain
LTILFSSSSSLPLNSFRDGNYCTKFIGEEYPKGFTNVELTPRERLEMIAATVALDQAKHSNEFATNPRLKAFRDDIDEHADTSVVAVLDGKAYSVSSSFENNMKVSITPLDDHNKPIRAEHSEFTLTDLEWNAERPLAKLTLEDRPNHETERFIQYVGRTPDGYQIRYLGADHSISIRSVREHQLSQYMLKPEVKDLANFVLSPMPGTLISCSVKPGQHVEAGQQLIVLEAMKMQNILRAERSGTIKSIKKDVGSPVKVDEVLIEFA